MWAGKIYASSADIARAMNRRKDSGSPFVKERLRLGRRPESPPYFSNHFDGSEPGMWRAGGTKIKITGAICLCKSALQILCFSNVFPVFARQSHFQKPQH